MVEARSSTTRLCNFFELDEATPMEAGSSRGQEGVTQRVVIVHPRRDLAPNATYDAAQVSDIIGLVTVILKSFLVP